MHPSLLSILIVVLCGVSKALAAEQVLTHGWTEVKEKKSMRLLLGTESASFGANRGTLHGLGFTLGFRYSLRPRWGLQANASQSMNLGGGSSLATAFGASLLYHIYGAVESEGRVFSWNGKPVVSEIPHAGNQLSIGLGLEQIMLNGATAIYPAPGGFVSVAWRTAAWERHWIVSARTGQYRANDETISGLFLSLSLLLD